MKISKWLALIVFFMLIPAFAHSEDYMDDKKPLITPYMKEKSDQKSDLTVTGNTAYSEDRIEVNTEQKMQIQKQIKAKSVCIGKDCRSQWPSLKCANYEGRPARETGDEFCGQMNQACMAVSMGGGQSFFSECSVVTNSVHRCRCCWVE
ncbi:MAG: hypothetical protein V1863_04420 [Candidatus Omnitrophota bacterium]